jgi:hypothetical protein
MTINLEARRFARCTTPLTRPSETHPNPCGLASATYTLIRLFC